MPINSPEFSRKTVTVMGLGGFGGGIGAVRFLAEAGTSRIIVTDRRTADELQDSLQQLDPAWPVTLRLGEHREADFQKSDLIVVSPAVPKDSPFLFAAHDACVPITSEMNLFWERNRGRVVAVTGSNGKSTTTALIHSIFAAEAARSANIRCWLGGNIGISLLPEVRQISPQDWVILELSSFQLEDLAPLRPRPEIAVITNFSPNHLDRHGTLAAYRAAKQQLVRWQASDQFAVVNQDSEVASWPTAATRLRFGPRDDRRCGVFGNPDLVLARPPIGCGHERQLPLRRWLQLPGRHNWQNAQAALAAAMAANISDAAIESGTSIFHGLPHRLEFVGDNSGRRCVNDSKSTTPEATILALQAFDEPLVLLAGGHDKHIDLTSMAEAIARRCKAVALLGQTGATLGKQIEQAARSANIPGPTCRAFESLAPAVDWSLQISAKGDTVLLSPGCASYGWFENYIERGEQFAKLVRHDVKL